MRPLIGGFILLIGLIFVILPGPAFFLIPIGLAFLALEYPWAKKVLRKCQRLMSKTAAKMDRYFQK